MGKCSLYLLHAPTLMLEDQMLKYLEDPIWEGAVISSLDLQHRLLFDPCWLLSPQRGQQEGGTGRVELKLEQQQKLFLRDLLPGHDWQNLSGTERLLINFYIREVSLQDTSIRLNIWVFMSVSPPSNYMHHLLITCNQLMKCDKS